MVDMFVGNILLIKFNLSVSKFFLVISFDLADCSFAGIDFVVYAVEWI